MISRLRRLLPKSLAGRLALLIVIVMICAYATTFVVIAFERSEIARATVRQFVVVRTASVYSLISETQPASYGDVLEAVNSPLFFYEISSQPIVKHSADTRLEKRIANAVAQEVALSAGSEVFVQILHPPRRRFREFDHGNDRDRRRWRRPPPPTSLELSLPFNNHASSETLWLNARIGTDDQTPRLAWISLISMLAASIVIAIIVFWGTSRLTKPLFSLATASKRFGETGTVQHVELRGAPEIQATINAFNEMQNRIHQFVADRTQMIGAMSHDLRTPITSLRLQAEFVDDDELRAKMIEIIDDMQAIAEATLAFAREDAESEPPQNVDIGELLNALCDDARARGLVVELAPYERIVCAIRVNAMKRVFNNLIDNACRYGHSAKIQVSQSSDGVTVTVDDDGPGIPAGDQERVFEPFVRLEKSRSKETGGVGLGLSIVRTIIRSHGGQITLSNRQDGGLRVTVALPVGTSHS